MLYKGFVVVVLGGMGSIVETLLGGMLLGVVEGLGAMMFGTGYRDLIGLLMSLMVLVVRPTGLFQQQQDGDAHQAFDQRHRHSSEVGSIQCTSSTSRSSG